MAGLVKMSGLCRMASETRAHPRTSVSVIRHDQAFGIAAKIVRSQFCHTDSLRALLYYVPDRLLCDAIAPNAAHFGHFAEYPATVNCSGSQPLVQFGNDPVGNRNRSDVSCLAQQIDNGPVFFPLLQMVESQTHGLMPSQTARQE